MQMKKTIIPGILLLSLFHFLAPSAHAQEEQEWKNNWYLSVGGGTQILFSSDVNNLEWKQRFTPAASLSGGKWFSPFLGVRLQATGYSLNGYSTSEGIYLGDPLNNGGVYGSNDPVRNEVTIRPDGSYRHYLRYVDAHVDIHTSLFNLFGGVKKRSWDIIPSVGIGYLHTFEYKGTPATDNISTHFALMGNYSLTKEWGINLELSGAAFPGSFDGRITRHTYEANTAITIGVTYNFGKTEKSKTSAKKDASINRILDRISDIDTKLNGIEKGLETVGESAREVRVEKEIVVQEVFKRESFVLASIRFDLYKSEPVKEQDITFVNIVKYLQENPEAKIRLEGYGDKEKGTQEENLRISQKRVEAVRQLLRNVHNVEEQRIEIQSFGADIQPYQNNSWNRVVVVTVI
jgi:outer membrane protein OmpA-like peptidoglycan-associated protein